MSRLLLLLLLYSAGSLAAPFVVSDPLDARVTHCNWFINGAVLGALPVVPLGPDNICELDVVGITADGAYVFTATAQVQDAGGAVTLESIQSPPFTATRLSDGTWVPGVSLSAPGNLRLQP